MKLWLEIFRRFAVISSVVLWLGGFTFYAGVVIPVGARVLHSHHKQGLITQQVTGWLNLIGVIALLILLWNILATKPIGRRMFIFLLLIWTAMGILHIALFVLHPMLDRLINPATGRITEFDRFENLHGVYGAVSTAQWACGIVYVIALLYVWTRERTA